MAKVFLKNKVKLISGGTDNHLILVDVYHSFNITGKEAETILDKIHITVNKNTIPKETLSPFKTSGIRIGSPAMTTRGLKEKDFEEIAEIICHVLKNKDDKKILNEEKKHVLEITKKFPLI